jgi:putative spermidine/putrescine transport system permease protein
VADAVGIAAAGEASQAPLPRRRLPWSWLGVVPFFAFAIAFILLPIGFLVMGSFQDSAGQLTLQNYGDLSQEAIVEAYGNSIEISLVTAVAGGVFGFLLAYAVILGGLPRFLRTALMTFAGVASNFAGVPLALAFVFTLGNVGLVTKFLLDTFGIRLVDAGFSLYTKIGLELVYLYFQFPLMVLIVAPALDGLKRDWREASENLGASPRQYWQHVALPILTPTLLGAVILLFGNSFGAQATAYQLTGGTLNIVTLVISSQMRGDVLHNPGLGYALAMGMVGIMALSITAYSLLQRRAERWLR